MKATTPPKTEPTAAPQAPVKPPTTPAAKAEKAKKAAVTPAAKAAKVAAPKAQAPKTAPKKKAPTEAEAQPRLLFLQSDSQTHIRAMRALLAGGRTRYCGPVLDDRIATPFNFYRYLYTRVAEQPRLIHPDHHPRLFSDFLAALPGLGGDAAPPGTRFLLALPLIRPRGPSSAAPFLPRIHALLRKGEARLLHVTTCNTLRLMAEAVPGRDLPVDRLLPQLRAHQRMNKQLQATLAPLPNALHLDDADLFAADGQITGPGRDRLKALLGGPVPARAHANPAASPPPLSKALPNFAAVAAKLRDTPFAWMTRE